MKLFGKDIAPGITVKVSLGLALIVLVALVASGVAKRYFDKSATLFTSISKEGLPLLIAASKLAKEVEGLISDGSELVLTQNPLLLESVSDNIEADHKKIQGLISQLNRANVVGDDLSRRSQQIFEDLLALVSLIKEDVETGQRILQISIYMRHTWESLTLEGDKRQPASTRPIRELFVKAFSLLRDMPNISDRQRLKEYQSQILALKNRIDKELKGVHFQKSPFTIYADTLERYGLGEKGLLPLTERSLRQKTLINDKLVQISFLSDELVKKTEQVFSRVSDSIQMQSQTVTQEMEWIGRLFLLIPLFIVISAILIFLFIRRSVIGRILALEQSMKAHIKGNHLPIPVKGKDEIASMARSVSYFVEKRKEYEATLHNARAAAEKANQAKSLFLGNMSHELRTPLNAILGFSQLLNRNKGLSPNDAEYLATIHQSGEHLLSLVNQLLDLSTIEAGRLTLKKSDFDFYELLREIEAMFRIQALHKNLKLVFERENNVPQFIQTDPLKLRQVLINLLNNAFKFTDKGGISLRVAVEKNNGELPENSFLRLRFEVEDTGVGIAPEEISKIFYAFEQVDKNSAETEGSGLGLTISRNFVELMGGHMTVKSEAGRGAFFQFDIDVKAVQAVTPVTPLRKVIALEPDQPRYRILVADDDHVGRRLLIRLLQAFEFDLEGVENGRQAIDVYESWRPHLIFMDMEMPVLNGYEATKQIKAADDKAQTKVIAISASSLENEQARFPVTGFDGYMIKPLMEEDVYRILERHLAIRWVYENDCGSNGPSTPVTPDEWRALLSPVPNELLKNLKDALLRADMGAIDLAIVKMADYSPSLAVQLQQLAHEFEYEKIISFLKEAHNGRKHYA